jgi:hypothetical protein
MPVAGIGTGINEKAKPQQKAAVKYAHRASQARLKPGKNNKPQARKAVNSCSIGHWNPFLPYRQEALDTLKLCAVEP